jgi:single-stranded-DNA-specific exonuclease
MKWLFPSNITASAALREAVGGHPLVADILARRGFSEAEAALAFLDPAHYSPSPPTELPDLVTAAEHLLDAIQRGDPILVWGDFDVDGQTSTALLTDALRHLGGQVSYHIPHRLKHGHGVQPDILKEYLGRGFRVILTCDTGVAAHEAADIARTAGAVLLITDHHALPERLPEAPAVVNPQRLPAGHSLRDLPGVGVAFMLARQMCTLAGRSDEALQFLDLVALGIVADVAPLRHDTRYLLQLGIEALRFPRRVGLQALMRSAGIDPLNMSADMIGYQLGPRLNALGRLDEARLAVELLTTDNEVMAQQIAAQLEVLNDRRKQIEDQIYGAAQEQIARDPSLLSFEALVLEGPNWHPGVIGIVASRLVEQYHKPVVLLTPAEDGVARGSARSVPGVDIGAAIAANADLLLGYGGHPGAAGLRLDADLIPQFRRRLSNTVQKIWDHSAVDGYAIDAIFPLADLSLELADELNWLAPFGAANPPVLLMDSGLRLAAHTAFGANGKHRRLIVEDGEGRSYPLIWWEGSESSLPPPIFDLLYIPRINDYRGRRSLQLEWVASRPTPGAVVEVEAGPRYRLVDWRSQTVAWEGLGAEAGVWVEGADASASGIPASIRRLDRATACPCPVLAIWTVPPGPQELEQMLGVTQPHTVYVIARHKPEDNPRAFLQRLGGLVKYALNNYAGEVSILKLASATAQREITVRRGLEWLAAKGHISLEWLDADRVHLVATSNTAETEREALQDAIRALLAEAAAYRAYFCQADLGMFFQL